VPTPVTGVELSAPLPAASPAFAPQPLAAPPPAAVPTARAVFPPAPARRKLELSWLQLGGALAVALGLGGVLGAQLATPQAPKSPPRARAAAVAEEPRVPEIKPLPRRKKPSDETTAARANADRPAPAAKVADKPTEKEKPAERAAADKAAEEPTRRETARAAEKEPSRRPSSAKPAAARAPAAKVAGTSKRKEKGWVDPFAQ
jgi:hypothetical protein